MLFPEQLRTLRQASGLKQKDLAKAIDVDVPMYSRFEHGERRPKREQVVKLAKLFKTDVEKLVTLWLAEAVINEIGTDRLADNAMRVVNNHFNPTADDEKPIQAPSIEQAAQSLPLVPQPEPPEKRNVVAKLSPNAFPLLLNGDALETLNTIEDESIDCVITTPPYWSLRQFGTESISTDNPQLFIEQIIAVMQQVRRVLKSSGSLWVNMGDAYDNNALMALPWRVAMAMIDKQGWILRDNIVWDKQQSAAEGAQDKMRNVHEMIFHFVKTDEFFFNSEPLQQAFKEAAKRKGANRASSSINSAAFMKKIQQSNALSQAEKNHAIAELNQMMRKVESGEVPDFKLFLREKGESLDPHSEKAKSINGKGYYFQIVVKTGTMPGDVWAVPAEKSPIEHYNTFPERLSKLLILATCPENGVVLDPFCGTAKTCKIAYELRRKSIGIDINNTYFSQTQNTLKQQPLSLF